MQTTQAEPTATATHAASLYQRLGGSDGIVALVDDIVAAHMSNPIIKARFLPYAADPERLGVIKKHLCAFLESGSGGPTQYTGRSMPDAHRGMNISEHEYVAAIDDILAVLRKHDISEQSQKDVLAIAYSLKDAIVHL
jgi:hemoglobin